MNKKTGCNLESVVNISGMQMNNVSSIIVGEHQATQVSFVSMTTAFTSLC